MTTDMIQKCVFIFTYFKNSVLFQLSNMDLNLTLIGKDLLHWWPLLHLNCGIVDTDEFYCFNYFVKPTTTGGLNMLTTFYPLNRLDDRFSRVFGTLAFTTLFYYIKEKAFGLGQKSATDIREFELKIC